MRIVSLLSFVSILSLSQTAFALDKVLELSEEVQIGPYAQQEQPAIPGLPVETRCLMRANFDDYLTFEYVAGPAGMQKGVLHVQGASFTPGERVSTKFVMPPSYSLTLSGSALSDNVIKHEVIGKDPGLFSAMLSGSMMFVELPGDKIYPVSMTGMTGAIKRLERCSKGQPAPQDMAVLDLLPSAQVVAEATPASPPASTNIVQGIQVTQKVNIPQPPSASLDKRVAENPPEMAAKDPTPQVRMPRRARLSDQLAMQIEEMNAANETDTPAQAADAERKRRQAIVREQLDAKYSRQLAGDPALQEMLNTDLTVADLPVPKGAKEEGGALAPKLSNAPEEPAQSIVDELARDLDEEIAKEALPSFRVPSTPKSSALAELAPVVENVSVPAPAPAPNISPASDAEAGIVTSPEPEPAVTSPAAIPMPEPTKQAPRPIVKVTEILPPEEPVELIDATAELMQEAVAEIVQPLDEADEELPPTVQNLVDQLPQPEPVAAAPEDSIEAIMDDLPQPESLSDLEGLVEEPPQPLTAPESEATDELPQPAMSDNSAGKAASPAETEPSAFERSMSPETARPASDLDQESVWHVRRGVSLAETLRRWSGIAGVDLIWDSTRDYDILSSDSAHATYGEAVNLILEQFQNARDMHPVGTLYVDPRTGVGALVIRDAEPVVPEIPVTQ